MKRPAEPATAEKQDRSAVTAPIDPGTLPTQQTPSTTDPIDWTSFLTTPVDNTTTEAIPDDLLGMWSEIMQGTGGNSVDLLQGMMAMPSTSVATETFSGFIDADTDWWGSGDG
jgi:hypothetical protein